MIKQVYVKKNGSVWRLSVSAWIGICKDGARNAGYAFPDECVVQEGGEADPDSAMIAIDDWAAEDFKDWLEGYWRGEIKPKAPEPIVPKQVQKVVELEPVAEPKPKAKKTRSKK